MMKKKVRVAFIGASMRSRFYVEALLSHYTDTYELCAVMDVDPGKMRGWNELLKIDLPAYTDFDVLCDEVKPDMVIITTVDAFHAQYVVKALDRKIATVSEKPLCVSAAQCRDILEAHRRNPEVFAATTHNARYGTFTGKLKELLDKGVIGRLRSARYSELLDLRHGLSYFRRWNSRKALSGGLQIHKACHHFDKLNWLLDSNVVSLTASGDLIAYGAGVRKAPGTHCHSCPQPCKYKAEFNPTVEGVFFKHKTSDSYTPDQCIYSPEIDIEDYLNASLEFANGIPCSYQLVAHAHYEGSDIIFEGEDGRIEACQHFIRLPREKGVIHDEKGNSRGETLKRESSIKIFRWGALPEEVNLEEKADGHTGAGVNIYDDLFGNNPSPILATLEEGIQAVLVGVAINEALKTGTKIDVQSLLKGIA